MEHGGLHPGNLIHLSGASVLKTCHSLLRTNQQALETIPKGSIALIFFLIFLTPVPWLGTWSSICVVGGTDRRKNSHSLRRDVLVPRASAGESGCVELVSGTSCLVLQGAALWAGSNPSHCDSPLASGDVNTKW